MNNLMCEWYISSKTLCLIEKYYSSKQASRVIFYMSNKIFLFCLHFFCVNKVNYHI